MFTRAHHNADNRGRRLGVYVTVALAFLACLAGPAPAAAQSPPRNDDVSALWQYREDFPTSSGPVIAQAGGAAAARVPLPTAVAARVEREGGADANALEEIATSPRLGAPRPLPRPARVETVEEPSLLEAATGIGLRQGGGSVVPLAIALPLLSVLLLAAAVVRRRRRA